MAGASLDHFGATAPCHPPAWPSKRSARSRAPRCSQTSGASYSDDPTSTRNMFEQVLKNDETCIKKTYKHVMSRGFMKCGLKFETWDIMGHMSPKSNLIDCAWLHPLGIAPAINWATGTSTSNDGGDFDFPLPIIWLFTSHLGVNHPPLGLLNIFKTVVSSEKIDL